MNAKILRLCIGLIGLAPVGMTFAAGDATCGVYPSTGNPFVCSNGGNCVWWAWKQASDNWGLNFPARGNANTWAAAVKGNSRYAISGTPTVGAIAQTVTSPYCTQTIKGKCVTWADSGHVAYVEAVPIDPKTKVKSVTVSEMTYGVSGVKKTTSATSRFENYITPVNLDGQDPKKTSCVVDAKPVITSTDKLGNSEILYWSGACQTNWATVTAKSKTSSVYVNVIRKSDGKIFSAAGLGSATTGLVNGEKGVVCVAAKIGNSILDSLCK